MQLQQITIEFIAEHDRLLMRLAGDDRSEVLLWLTRRCVKLLWPQLVKLAESVPQIARQPVAEARQALLDMERERALQHADFSKPYDGADRARPLGSEPLLIARMNTGRNEEGKHVLALLPLQGQGVNLGMDDTLLHGVCKLLQDAVEKTDWDMKLALPTASVPQSTEGAPRRLN